VPIVAGVSERQARIAFNTARRMVELSAPLRERCQLFQDRIYWPHDDASLFPLLAEADALLGANPTLTIVDELGVVTEDVFDAMRLATGKRADTRRSEVGSHADAAPGERGLESRSHRVEVGPWRRRGRLGSDPSQACAMTNELSQPQLVVWRCSVHGPQLQAPPSYHAMCRCGRQCTIDVADWVATQLAQRPGEDVEALARQAGVSPHQARAALKQRD
jgi:hypothetical protein